MLYYSVLCGFSLIAQSIKFKAEFEGWSRCSWSGWAIFFIWLARGYNISLYDYMTNVGFWLSAGAISMKSSFFNSLRVMPSCFKSGLHYLWLEIKSETNRQIVSLVHNDLVDYWFDCFNEVSWIVCHFEQASFGHVLESCTRADTMLMMVDFWCRTAR